MIRPHWHGYAGPPSCSRMHRSTPTSMGSPSAWEPLSVRQLSPQPVDGLLSGIRVHVKNRELPVTSLFERELTSAVDAVLLLAVSRTSPNSSRKGGPRSASAPCWCPPVPSRYACTRPSTPPGS